ncbi:MAG: flagellar hook-length control protein FliK [Caulobacterales bacterium]
MAMAAEFMPDVFASAPAPRNSSPTAQDTNAPSFDDHLSAQSSENQIFENEAPQETQRTDEQPNAQAFNRGGDEKGRQHSDANAQKRNERAATSNTQTAQSNAIQSPIALQIIVAEDGAGAAAPQVAISAPKLAAPAPCSDQSAIAVASVAVIAPQTAVPVLNQAPIAQPMSDSAASPSELLAVGAPRAEPAPPPPHEPQIPAPAPQSPGPAQQNASSPQTDAKPASPMQSQQDGNAQTPTTVMPGANTSAQPSTAEAAAALEALKNFSEQTANLATEIKQLALAPNQAASKASLMPQPTQIAEAGVQQAAPTPANNVAAAPTKSSSNVQSKQAAAGGDSAAARATPQLDASSQLGSQIPGENNATSASSDVSAKETSHNVASAANQVTREIVRRHTGGGTQFELRLDPPELGRVDVKIEVSKDHKVTALITADSPQALSDLARAAREIESSLQSAGLDLSENGLSFDLSQNQSREGAADRAEAPALQRISSNETEEAMPARAARPIGLEHWRGVRVDLVA